MARHPRNDNTEADSGFVSRWSRRKQQSREQEQKAGEPGDIDQQDPAPAQEPAADAAPPEPVKTDADMPSLDSITESSSVADFFSPGVSEELRKMALRKLFRTAKFNIRDGLDDYDEDFRTFASLGDIVTADMKHQQELAEARAREQAQARPGAEEVEPVSHGEEEVQAEVSDADESGASAEAAEGEQRADSVAGTDEHVADDDEQSKEATPT